jgi:hypothetical protein
MSKATGGGRRDRAPEKAGVDPEFAKRFLGRFEGSPVGMDTPLEVAFEAVYRELFAPEVEPSERESAVGEAPEPSNLASRQAPLIGVAKNVIPVAVLDRRLQTREGDTGGGGELLVTECVAVTGGIGVGGAAEDRAGDGGHL